MYVFLLAFFICGSFIALSFKIKNPVLAQGSQSPKKILVKLKSSPQTSSLLSVSDSLPQAQLLGGISSTNVVVYKVDGDINQAIADVKSNANVETAFEDKTVYLQKTTSDPFFTNQWALTSLKAAGTNSGWDQIADIANKTAQVKVAVIDTGVDSNHEDLAGKISQGDMISCVYQSGNTNLDCVAGGVDDQGHGTHVAGIIGAVTDNQKGVAGVGWGVKLMSIKVLDANGSGSLSDALIGMYYAVDHGAKVLNLSLGSPKGGTNGLTDEEIAVIQEVVDYVIQSGAVIVAAAGNCGDSGSGDNESCGNLVNPIMYPAAANNVISVASLDPNNNLASYSEHGNWVSVAAPGGSCSSESNKNDCILSTLATSINCSSLGIPGPVSGYCYLQGTSMAAPQAAGVAALLFAAKAGITNTQVKDIILQTANSGVAKGPNATIWGGVDALAAVAAVSTNLSPTGNNATPTTSAGATITPVLSLYPTTGIAKLPGIPPNPYPAPPYCPVTTGCSKKFLGDANCNGVVDLADLGIWFIQFDTLAPAIPNNNNANFFCQESNSATYFVDLSDFEAWRRNTTDLGYILPTSIPTPTVFYPSNTPVPPTNTPPPAPTDPPANNTQPPPASTSTPTPTTIIPYYCPQPSISECYCDGIVGGCCLYVPNLGVTSVICTYNNGSCTEFAGEDEPWCGLTPNYTYVCHNRALVPTQCASGQLCYGGVCAIPSPTP